jgi:alpha-tubulin suppressor-like RCC1 family protein
LILNTYIIENLIDNIGLTNDEKIVSVVFRNDTSSVLTSNNRILKWGSTQLLDRGLYSVDPMDLSNYVFLESTNENIEKLELRSNGLLYLTNFGNLIEIKVTYSQNTGKKIDSNDLTQSFDLIVGEKLIDFSGNETSNIFLTSFGRVFSMGTTTMDN